MDRVGNYRIESELAHDAQASVYAAVHLVLPRRAFVKVMVAAGERPTAVALLREACILEALNHPGVVRVYESGLLPDRRAWFAHERIEGASIADVIARGPLDPAAAAGVLRDVAEVLEHAHRRGIVHGGLRPDRIALAGLSRGFPLCISDWSTARIHDTSSPPPAPPLRTYAAPELIAGDPIDDRADIYALGVVAYQALTGQLPDQNQPVITEVHCPEAPRELTGLVDQMLAVDRWDRPSSTEVRNELSWLADELSQATARDAASGIVRMRRPRWTPSLSFDASEPTSPEDPLPTSPYRRS